MARFIVIILLILLVFNPASCSVIGTGCVAAGRGCASLGVGCTRGVANGCGAVVRAGANGVKGCTRFVVNGVKFTFQGIFKLITSPIRFVSNSIKSGCSFNRGVLRFKHGSALNTIKNSSSNINSVLRASQSVPKGSLQSIKSFKTISRGKYSSLPLPKNMSKYEMNLLRSSKINSIAGRKVATNNKIFKHTNKSKIGRNNCARMASGLSPIGIDGGLVNLHHLGQMNDGVIVEILTTEHQRNSSSLHYHRDSSEIDRARFSQWKKDYWKARGKALCQ